MRRGAAVVIGLVLAAALLTGAAAGRQHRLHRPPSDLPHQLSVDEWEWIVQPSQNVVGAGVVHINAYNRGMDDHDVQLIGPHGIVNTVFLSPGSSGTITAKLAPGRYQLICSLYEGTPESHYARGMHAWLTVR
jgi:uncharacterized cupredoxin-like copper-binding protein